MSNSTQMEIDRLDGLLKTIYLRTPLTAAEQVKADGLWARIERLETAQVAISVREAKAQDAIKQAKAMEGIE